MKEYKCTWKIDAPVATNVQKSYIRIIGIVKCTRSFEKSHK